MIFKSDNIKKFFYTTGKGIPNSLLFAKPQLILPTYHLISASSVPHIKNLYKTVKPNTFIKSLDFLLRNFEPIGLEEIKNNIHNNREYTKNQFHLSFDDGLRECYDFILPILKQKGIPATFFINPNFVDNKGLMHRYKVSLIIEDLKKSKTKRDKVVRFIKKKMGIRREASSFLLTLKYPHTRILNEVAQITETDFEEYLKFQKPYMTSEQIHSLITNGFTIGAHSLDHPEYIMLSEEEQLRQTINSIKSVTDEFKLSYKVFAFPFTDFKISKNFFDKLYSTNLCDLSFGVAGLKSDIISTHLQRIPMEKNYSGEKIIKGEYLYYYIKEIINKNNIIRK